MLLSLICRCGAGCSAVVGSTPMFGASDHRETRQVIDGRCDGDTTAADLETVAANAAVPLASAAMPAIPSPRESAASLAVHNGDFGATPPQVQQHCKYVMARCRTMSCRAQLVTSANVCVAVVPARPRQVALVVPSHACHAALVVPVV